MKAHGYREGKPGERQAQSTTKSLRHGLERGFPITTPSFSESGQE